MQQGIIADRRAQGGERHIQANRTGLTEATIGIGTPDAGQYFILPAFLIDGELIHQGGITKEDAKNILNKALE